MSPSLSVVVVVYDMDRELPRTLRTLDPGHQAGIAAADYEVVVVDNGSPRPVDPAVIAGFSGAIRVLRLDPAPPSPARAANEGVAAASGVLVGLVVDGARMASPGLLAHALLAGRLVDRPVVTASAFHLGSVSHGRAAEVGYDQRVEDDLLEGCGWEDDGYRLFSVSTLARSSWRGIFGPMGESSSLFLHREQWDQLGGLDERFDRPGGGLVNHDLYHRACSLPGAHLVHLMGEGSFHQFHGGATTSGGPGWKVLNDEYRAIRGHSYRPPEVPALHLGTVHPSVLSHLEHSARVARDELR